MKFSTSLIPIGVTEKQFGCKNLILILIDTKVLVIIN